jgi:hypothetical protein
MSKTLVMKNGSNTTQPSTLQELAGFLTVLNGNKVSGKPLLSKAEGCPDNLIYHLNKRFGDKAA